MDLTISPPPPPPPPLPVQLPMPGCLPLIAATLMQKFPGSVKLTCPENATSPIMLYQAARSKIILGWSTFQGYVTLPSHGNFTQTDVVNPTWVWLPNLGTVTQAG